MSSHTYILYSTTLNKFYIGACHEDLDQRIENHNAGAYGSKSFTSNHKHKLHLELLLIGALFLFLLRRIVKNKVILTISIFPHVSRFYLWINHFLKNTPIKSRTLKLTFLLT
ncbi:hypothetical protein CSC80_06590 [Maribacter sp. 6B07]|uniref:GIY-YIG nuclease family protein n=1 Tax=Maribacter sp. 1_2014MBL_MicDiv TaxID=1644130 RepID=UPI0009F72F35|nr:hypothetical protein CSC80_06590 [Maribacter sp. 6B07]